MRIVITPLEPAFFSAGILLIVLSGFMGIPLLINFGLQEGVGAGFTLGCFLSLFIGGLLAIAFHRRPFPNFQIRTAFFFTTFSWFIILLLSAIPFVFSQDNTSYTRGFLEATSALTTTGFSSFESMESTPVSILVWRALLQWLGGIGITIMALTLFPFLKVGGMQLFASESSSHYDKILPRVSQVTKTLLAIYIIMTVSCIGLLWMAGMEPLRAFCYGVSTVSTSGMSMLDGSQNYLSNTFVVWVLITFMFFSASPLLLAVRVIAGGVGVYLKDAQMKAYMRTLCGACVFVILFSCVRSSSCTLDNVQQSIFYTISMLTTAGFQSEATHSWPPFLELSFLILSIIGGCTGSTAGGIKIFRFQIIYRTIRAQVWKMIMPHGVFTPVYNKKIVKPEAIYAVVTLIALFIIHIFLLSLLLIANHVPFLHALELSIHTLSNCGASFLPLDIQILSVSAQWMVSIGMILGRLEFLTVWIILLPIFWKH